MYSLLKNNPKPSKAQIEHSLDGNICRCTGYRAILDSMKSFAHNEEPIDIEDLKNLKCLNKEQCCSAKSNNCSIQIEDQIWHSPENINDLFDILNKHKKDSVKLVSGNTSVGYYKDQESFQVYINLKNVLELQRIEREDENIKIGSAVSLSSLVSSFEKFASSDGFNHLNELAASLRKIGNTHVRNMASWSGNLVMKKQHPDFQSDVVVFLEAVSAQIEVFQDGNTSHMTISEFLSNEQLNSGLYLITSMRLPKLNNKLTRIKMFKITPRAQNSLSYISCGFRFDFTSSESSQIASKPIIAFNGVNQGFFRASRLESYLEFNNIQSEDVFKESIEILKNELRSSGLFESTNPLLASPQYRANLCLSLYYKFVLSIVQPHIKKEFESALESIVDTRPISKGSHTYEKNEQLFPFTKPIPKLSSYAQTSGESKYVDDLSELTHQLHGAFILTQVASARISSICTEEALKMPGVKRILLAKDILGENNIMPKPFKPEPLFTDDLIEYAGQPVGLVIADTYEQAKQAAKLVKVNYSVVNTPILTISDAIKANSFHPQPVNDLIVGNADEAIENAQHKIQGEMEFHGTQFNFYLEV
jgi:xanthine dehydrogenase/oxidase